MNVNPTNNRNISNIAKDFVSNASGAQASHQNNAVGSTVGQPYLATIERAMELDQVNPSAVNRAREMIASGELDSIENIRQAANNIVILGI